MAFGLIACSSNSSSTSTNDSTSDEPGTDTGADISDQPSTGPVSTRTLQNAGFQNEIPLLDAQTSIILSEEFSDVDDHVFSPDGSRLAVAISENTLFNPPPNPEGDRIQIYSTDTGELLLTLDNSGSGDYFGNLYWSSADEIHWFHGTYAGSLTEPGEATEHWTSWNAQTGTVVQTQSVVRNEPCDRWSGMSFDAFHSATDTLVFVQKNTDNTQSHLCRLNLSDYSTAGAVIDYPVLGSPLISPDGSITALMQATYPDSPASIERTHTYDTDSLAYRDEVIENEGFPESLGSDFRVAKYGSSYLYLLPSGERLDMGTRDVEIAETGTLLSARNPESRVYSRFVTLPDGIVIGDVEEPSSLQINTRLLSPGGEVAAIARHESATDSVRLDIYSLSGRTNYTALIP